MHRRDRFYSIAPISLRGFLHTSSVHLRREILRSHHEENPTVSLLGFLDFVESDAKPTRIMLGSDLYPISFSSKSSVANRRRHQANSLLQSIILNIDLLNLETEHSVNNYLIGLK